MSKFVASVSFGKDSLAMLLKIIDEGLLLDLIRQVCRKEAGLRSCKKCPYYGKEYYCENRTDPIYYYANLIVPVYEKIKEADNGSKN